MLYDTNEEDGEEQVEEAEEVEKEKKRNAIPGFLLTVFFIYLRYVFTYLK